MESGALDGKAGLQEGVQAEKAAAEELRARNDLADASRYGHYNTLSQSEKGPRSRRPLPSSEWRTPG